MSGRTCAERLLRPGRGVTVALALLAVALTVWGVFYAGDNPLVYAGFALSAYALVVVVVRVVDAVLGSLSSASQRDDALGRVLTDQRYRSGVTLRASLVANLVFVLYQGYLGVSRHSAWAGTLCFLYLVLTAIRGGLVRRIEHPVGERGEWLAYRTCARLILGLALAMAGLAALTTVFGAHKDLGTVACIAYAAWCFYLVSIAASNVVRYRALRSPVLSAAKATSLAGALISLYSMQGALIARFGEGTTNFAVRANATVGFVVFMGLLTMVVYMSARAARALSALTTATAERTEEGKDA